MTFSVLCHLEEEIRKLCWLTKPWLQWWSGWTLRSLCLLVFPLFLKSPGVEHTDTTETVSILLIQFQMRLANLALSWNLQVLFFAEQFLANIRSRLALNLSKLRYSLYAVCWEKIIRNKTRGMSVEMKEKELTVSKKIAKQKAEDYNTNIFHRCFNLFSLENVAP